MSKQGLFNYGQDIVMAFSPPVVGCLVKKGLQKGGSRAPRTPSGYALACQLYMENFFKNITLPFLSFAVFLYVVLTCR